MQEVDIEAIEQNLNNFLFEHAPAYYTMRYKHHHNKFYIDKHSQVESVNLPSLAQYTLSDNTIRIFSSVKPSKLLLKTLQTFCLLNDITYSDAWRRE